MTLPPIRIEAGRVMAGPDIELRASHRHWRKRAAWWRAWRGKEKLTDWCFSPQAALAAALRKRKA